MEIKLKYIFLLGLAVGVNACSSDKPVTKSIGLATTPHGQSYYYCESCPAPSVLTKGAYKPLEPDEPVIIALPVTETPIIKPPHKRSHHKLKKRKKTKHIQKSKPKQCIQWSN